VWKTRSESAPKKRVIISAGKVLVTVFWDSQGVLLVDYLEEGI